MEYEEVNFSPQNWFFLISQNYVLLENLDGTILIGTQPHIRDRVIFFGKYLKIWEFFKKKFVHCWSCRKIQSCSQSAKCIKCGSCGALNGIPGSNEEDLDKVSK